MSDSGSASNANRGNRPLCRYFASNICFRGDQCPYSHDRNGRLDMTCKFYLAGNCSYGKICRYDHVRPNDPQSAPEPIASKPEAPQPIQPQSSGSSRFPTLPSRRAFVPDNNQPKPAEDVLQKAACSSKSNTKEDPSQMNAWNKPLQSSAAFSMNAMSNELDQINNGDGFYAQPGDVCNIKPEDFLLCPYFTTGYCINGDFCEFLHGWLCDMCNMNILHPFNEEQRKEHHRSCLAEHEKAMEEAFAEARSIDKKCGVCMEMIVEKRLRFGILQNCKHCFCLKCIREWRKRSEQYETKTVRSCPECRVLSDYIIPSETWVEDQDEKDKLISLYRENMKQKQCKYIKAGQVDDCPFGNKCFYKHQMPDGTVVEGQSPSSLRRRRRFVLNIQHDLLEDSDDDDIMNEVISSLVATMGGTLARARTRFYGD
ncbi:ring finger domain-containing protein [Ditylenchus destructor]|nr:ring finger domain-containing protein [Ditylenchus destructor]